MRYVRIAAFILVLGGFPARAQDAESAPVTPVDGMAIPAPAMMTPADAGSFMRGKDGEIIDSAGGGAIPALPLQPYIKAGVQYVSGGIGDEELAQLKMIESEYNVRVMLSSKGGAYVANVRLRVLDGGGKEVLSVADAGPFVYIHLPPGKYTLEGKRNGETKKTAVTVTAKRTAKPHLTFLE